jgi:hypothetical protein
MPHTNDHRAVPDEGAREVLLLRTRRAVLDVLMGVAVMIAVGGWLLGRRADDRIAVPARGTHDGLLIALFVVGIVSYFWRRRGIRSSTRLPIDRRRRDFYWSHVGAAAIAALGAPLGLAYGWWVDPRLEAVIPFWVIPLALGFLSIPRRAELDDIDPSRPNPEDPPR